MSRTPQVFAHRGGRAWAPENTLASFAMAVGVRCDGIELDVQRCSTGELVVIHDVDIGRTTNGVGLVHDISFDELRRVSAGLWFDREFRDQKIPLLQEVLDLVDGKLFLSIEIKNTPIEYPGIEEDLIEALSGYAHKDKVSISSFDHQVLRKFKDAAPELETALLADALFLDVGAYAKQLGATFWHPSYDSIRESAVEEAHAAGLRVNTWTVNDPRDWARAIKMGVDGIITDDPEGLLNFVHRMDAMNQSQ